jgi:hypothetical protein
MQLAFAEEISTFQFWAERQTTPTSQPAPAEAYRFTGQFFQSLGELMAERPGVVQAEVIGKTTQGRPIWAFHVQKPASTPKRKVLIFGGIHALEWISTEVATDTLLWLIKHPPEDAMVTVIPLLNPDGRAKVERDLLEGKNSYRRGNAINIDLNRDFAHNRKPRAVWRHVLPGYYSSSPAPLSQPESRALDRLAGREHYDRSASLHAFGGLIYYPWAGLFAHPPDRKRFIALARAMQQAQGAHAYRPLQLGRWGFFFRAHGAEIDHLYGEYGTLAYLIEVTRSGLKPLHPKTWKSYFRWYNPIKSLPHRERGRAALRALILTDENDLPPIDGKAAKE